MAVFICQGCGTELASWSGRCPTCGTTETIRLAPTQDRMIGKVVRQKYKIVQKLGQGGMGAVYLGEQVGIGHRVALKFLKSEFSADAEIARRFLNEAKSYARVAHPNAVILHDFGQDEEGSLFIAMEYCEGVDLKRILAQQKRLSIGEAIELCLQVADVLGHAHQKGVVHRDLKPENIMVRRGMRGLHAKVLDFGIARLLNEGTQMTIAGSIAGTPRYMSPEQVEGQEVDLRADIYSLGIVLFECLTGRQPFDGTTVAEILRKQVKSPMPHLKEVSADVDFPEIDSVIQTACAKKPQLRWGDMTRFATALSKALPTQASLQYTSQSGILSTTALAAHATATHNAITPAALLATPLTLPQVTQGGESGLGATFESPSTSEVIAQSVSSSKAPLFALLALLGLAAIAGVYALRPTRTPEPVVSGTASKPPVVNAGSTVTPKVFDEASKQFVEVTARTALGQGKTAFDVGKLDESETYLKSIAAETASFAEAEALLKKIATIRGTLAQAQTLRERGQCPQALTLFHNVLALNDKVEDAVRGASACRASVISPVMEP